jgi:hypothetical protein
MMKDFVLPDGPPALSHPTNEDLFAGTPVRRSFRDGCTLSCCGGLARLFADDFDEDAVGEGGASEDSDADVFGRGALLAGGEIGQITKLRGLLELLVLL